jgi:hypothetical protein
VPIKKVKRDTKKRPMEPEDDVVDDDEIDEAAIDRDFCMARLAAARASLQAACNAVDEALVLFVNPDEDSDGTEREENLSDALEAVGAATIALQQAEAVYEEVDPELGEPDDEDED